MHTACLPLISLKNLQMTVTITITTLFLMITSNRISRVMEKKRQNELLPDDGTRSGEMVCWREEP